MNRKSSLAASQSMLGGALSSLGAAWPSELLEGVVPGGTLDKSGALEVYRHGYVVRLTDQLGETYASVWRVLGDEDFFALCHDYVAGHSSVSWNLSDYGGDFGAFLETTIHARDFPFLPELARFEWGFHDLFHVAAHLPVAAEELAALVNLDGVKLRLGAAVRVVDCERAVYDVFRHRYADELPTMEIDRKQRVLMFKQHGELLAREIDAATFAVLVALGQGLAVNDAIARAVEVDPDYAEADVARLFELIVRCDLLAAVER